MTCTRGKPHKILLVEQWSPLGAHCVCLICNDAQHYNEPDLQKNYIGFQHTSVQGPLHDECIFVHFSLLEER